MNVFVQVMVMLLPLVTVGSALKCYSCQDLNGSCSNTETCSVQNNACLTLTDKTADGRIYRQCVRSSDCQSTPLSVMFPSVAKFSYSCCGSDLCNGASASVGRISVMALLLSLVLSWCFF